MAGGRTPQSLSRKGSTKSQPTPSASRLSDAIDYARESGAKPPSAGVGSGGGCQPVAGAWAELLGQQMRCTDATLEVLRAGRTTLREKLDGAAVSMLRGWFTRAVRDQQVETACAVRAHMAYLYRNVSPKDLDIRGVAALLISQARSSSANRFPVLHPCFAREASPASANRLDG